MPILCHCFETSYFYLKFRHSLSFFPSPFYILLLYSSSVLTVSSQWVTIKLSSLSLASLLLIILSSAYCQLHMDIPKKPLITALYTFMFLILVSGITVLLGHLAEKPRSIFVLLFVILYSNFLLPHCFLFVSTVMLVWTPHLVNADYYSWMSYLMPIQLLSGSELNSLNTPHYVIPFLKNLHGFTDTRNNLFDLPYIGILTLYPCKIICFLKILFFPLLHNIVYLLSFTW